MNPTKYAVTFCGAGPGDPDLITVKGMRALETADLVLYAGSLVPEAVLAWAPEGARRISSAGMDLEDFQSSDALGSKLYHKDFRHAYRGGQ